MMVIISTIQLVPLIERAIERTYGSRPENLAVEPTFLCESAPDWQVRAHYDEGGHRRQVELVLEPRTGRLLRAQRS